MEDSVKKGSATHPRTCHYLKNCMFGKRCKYYHPERHRRLTSGTKAAYSQGNISTSRKTGNFENRSRTIPSLEVYGDKGFATHQRICPHLMNCTFGNRCKYYHPERHGYPTYGTEVLVYSVNVSCRNTFTSSKTGDFENRLWTIPSLEVSVDRDFPTPPRICPYLKNCKFGDRCKYYHPERRRSTFPTPNSMLFLRIANELVDRSGEARAYGSLGYAHQSPGDFTPVKDLN